MKKIFSFLFAILFAVGTTGVFSSCQEDAPEITINITMNNDFSDVVNAINNGTLKQEAAVAALTAAINGMNGEQNAKMDAIVKAINDLAKTTDAKLAIIEAAMKAQTLALEAKLALLETAIKNIPDYSEKMAAIEAAIKNAPNYTTALEEIKKAIADAEDSFATQLGLLITAVENLPDYGDQLTAIKNAIPTIPNYEDQLAALETALEAIADNIEDQKDQYADELAALKASIDAIKSAVAVGNTSQEEALAQIIALLKSGAIAGGGSGSGSGSGSGGEGEGSGGEGEGGEGSGDEPTGTYILFTTKKSVGSIIEFACYESELTKIEGVEGGVEGLTRTDTWHGDVPVYQGILESQEVILYGIFTKFCASTEQLTKIDTHTQSNLEVITLNHNPELKFDFEANTKLEEIRLNGRTLSKDELYDLANRQLHSTSSEAICYVDFVGDGYDTYESREVADDKGWIIDITYL